MSFFTAKASLPPGSLAPRIEVRKMATCDHKAVIAIEAASLRRPWRTATLARELGQPGCCGWVALLGSRVVGFVACEMGFEAIRILAIAVDPEVRRRRVGSALLLRPVDRLEESARTRAVARVPARSLDALHFLAANGFLATRSGIEPDHYRDPDGAGEDAYTLVFDAGEDSPC